MLIALEGFGSIWSVRTKASSKRAAYFNTTGISVSGRCQHRSRVYGHLRFNDVGGFNANQLILLTFAVSGALAGLAGIIEVAGPIGHLQPGISPGYGFTAIIVAFLGRLNPIGILIAGLFLALTFIGGEQAQIAMKIPLDVTKVFQGILLFYVLACDSLILYRFRLISTSRQVQSGAP